MNDLHGTTSANDTQFEKLNQNSDNAPKLSEYL